MRPTDILKIGSVLSVNPETNFSDNPRGGYRNPDNSIGEQVSMNSLVQVGLGFAFGSGKDNMIIKGGDALKKYKNGTRCKI